jgi:outer membrane protein assembly factor BamB
MSEQRCFDLPRIFLLLGLGAWALMAPARAAERGGDVGLAPVAEQARTWTDATGKHKTQASLAGVDGEKVRLKKSDGTIVVIAIERLSADDQAWLNSRSAPATASAGKRRTETAPGDWPQFRGPDRTGVASGTALLKEWPEAGPPLAWKTTNLGEGYSSPSVSGGRVFGMSYRGEDEVVWALQESDGKELWSVRIAGANRRVGLPEGARATPTVDGARLYTLGVSGDLVCMEAGTGKLVWQKNLVADFGGKVPPWGYSESPLIDGTMVAVTPGQDKATLVALDKNTGEPLWQCAVPQAKEAQYSSIMLATVGGQRQFLQILLGRAVGVSARDGKLLWQWEKPISPRYNCASVIVRGDAFFAPGFHTAGGAARIVRDGDEWRVEELFVDPKHKCSSGGMVLLDGHLYGDHDGNLCCSEFTSGKIVWEDRRGYAVRTRRGAVACADGRLYYRREDGTMHLVEAAPHGFAEHGRFAQPDRSNKTAFPPPVIANGRLYLRDQDLLLCYDVRQK